MLIAWFICALVSIFNITKVASRQCYFLNSWPFCKEFISTSESVAQGVVLVSVFSFLSFGFIALWRKIEESKKYPTLGFMVVSIVAACLVLPFSSFDLNYYFNVGKTVNLGSNPYISTWEIVPEYTSDALVKSAEGVMYGPITVQTFHYVYVLSNGNIAIFIGLIKTLIITAFVGCSILTYSILKKYMPGTNRTSFCLFYLLQPLLLWEWVVNGHFDAWWLFWVLLAIGSAMKNKWWLVCVALSIGVWIKFIPILMFPWFALWWWQETNKENSKRQITQLLIGVGLSAVITVLVWAPYWTGLEVFSSLAIQSKWVIHSLFAVVYYTFQPLFESVMGSNFHWLLTRVVHGLLFGMVCYWLYPYIKKVLLIIIKKATWDMPQYVTALFVTMLVYSAVWQKSLWPWYVAWLLPFAVLILRSRPQEHIRKIYLYLSIAPLFFYVPWMLERGDTQALWFFYSTVILIFIYPFAQLYQWRKKQYE